jgi:hypothetical protein
MARTLFTKLVIGVGLVGSSATNARTSSGAPGGTVTDTIVACVAGGQLRKLKNESGRAPADRYRTTVSAPDAVASPRRARTVDWATKRVVSSARTSVGPSKVPIVASSMPKTPSSMRQ